MASLAPPRLRLCFHIILACTSDARERENDLCNVPLFFQTGGQRGQWYLFITVSYVISSFIKNDLKQIYCSYSRIQKSHKGFRQYCVYV